MLGEPPAWSTTEHLLAMAIDAAQIGNWLTAKAHFKNAPPQPTPIPRPGSKPTHRFRPAEEMRRLADKYRRPKHERR